MPADPRADPPSNPPAGTRPGPAEDRSVLVVPEAARRQMVAHALVGFPLEACGLLVGEATGGGSATVRSFHPCQNVAESSKLYTVAPGDMLRVDREADDAGLEVVGVMHSHTHTDPYPSPTDVAQAPDPGWHYVIVSLRDDVPMLRSFRIVDGSVAEEPVVVHGGESLP